jgi:hypothetical protein
LETTFFVVEISPNGDPKINPLTFSKGFLMKIFNNFSRKIKEKRGVLHISIIFSIVPLALGLRPRQGLARARANKEARECGRV